MAEVPVPERVEPLVRRTARDGALILLGMAGGFVLARLLRPRPGPGAERAGALDRWSRAWDEAVDGAAAGLSSARELVRPRADLDLGGLEKRLSEVPGSAGCRARVLGDGIVEVIGTAESEDARRALLDTAAAEPGVDVVVDRIWTPSSAAPGEPASRS